MSEQAPDTSTGTATDIDSPTTRMATYDGTIPREFIEQVLADQEECTEAETAMRAAEQVVVNRKYL